MRMYHWQVKGFEFFVLAAEEVQARTAVVEKLKAWRWQDEKRFADAVQQMETEPPFSVVHPGHVISIDCVGYLARAATAR